MQRAQNFIIIVKRHGAVFHSLFFSFPCRSFVEFSHSRQPSLKAVNADRSKHVLLIE